MNSIKYSKLFGKTVREAPANYKLTSHKLLHQAGFIRESSAGRYYFLPLGIRVRDKIAAIIEEEMDRAGAQKMITPVLHSLGLWEETHRTESAGFELMTLKDRRGSGFALGGTAEEMFVDLVRKFKLSYKDLPFNVYQFSSKFRDELRARGGLLRTREFVMKDAYSFHVNEKDFNQEYENMAQTYTKIFDRLGLKTVKVAADNGYIGGDYSHEFIVENAVGESKYFQAGDYIAHEEVATFNLEKKNSDEKPLKLKEVVAKRGPTMDNGVKLHKLPLWQQIKDLMLVDDKNNFVLGVIRGDLNINELKLSKLAGLHNLRHATKEEIIKLGSYPGFISPIGLSRKVKIVVDPSLKTIANAYTGANKKDHDFVNVNFGRDFKADFEGDIAQARAGDKASNGQKLIEKRGIEVGNIFQLGFHYTNLMKNATFTDEKGKPQKYYMGCYGIGLGRSMATLVEVYSDEKGIIWPAQVAPYQVHLISLQGIDKQAQNIYQQLGKAGVEVLWDDREDVSAGIKFADADLIGIPFRAIVSKKTGTKIEVKSRNKNESKLVELSGLVNLVTREGKQNENHRHSR